MFRNNLKIALRNLLKNKTSSFINIAGLTAGITVAILIGLWLLDELSYNKNHKNYNRIGRIMVRGVDAKHGSYINSSLPFPLSAEMRASYSNNFKEIVRASWVSDYVLSAGDKNLIRTGQYMDANAPHMFTLKMTEGTRDGLLSLHSVLLSASSAKALFGDKPALNKTIRINNGTDVTITGVYEDLPLNSEFQNIKFIAPFELWVSQNPWINERAVNDWNNNFMRIYVELDDARNYAAMDQRIRNAMLDKIRGQADYKENAERKPELFIYAMSDWHLYPLSRKGMYEERPLRMVWLVGSIGFFVLILACINFMNLSTARSEKRAKEVGIRKTIGGNRGSLVLQFFSEVFLLTLMAFLLAMLSAWLLLNWFNELSGKEMTMPWSNPLFWGSAAGFIVITTFMAGSYPAIYLSSFNPVKVLKGTYRAGKLASLPRKVLVVVQFSISITLIICTMAIFKQLQLGKDRPVGYKQEGLVMLPMLSDDFSNKYDLLKNELMNTGMVAGFSQSMGKVTEVSSGNNGFEWKGKDPEDDKSFGTLAITADHGRTIGWEFLMGRDFIPGNKADSGGVVINEAAARTLGFKDPVGQTIYWKWRSNGAEPYTVLGVIKDPVMESPYKEVEPAMFFIKALNGGVNWINIRIHPKVSFESALTKIESVFKKMVPSAPFDYRFADIEYETKFKAELRASKLAGFFAGLAIFICCLGLFGLSSFTAEQRTKEIGVRRVLGATVASVWHLLSKEFFVLVLISFLMAAPLAYYFMSGWLEDYQYRANLSWWLFAIAAIGALLVTLITVSYQAIRAAMANPVRSLRSE